jgi:hypothetical protein
MRGNRKIDRRLPGGGLVRGADGRLRPASGGVGLDDIWAEQKRLQLKEAILRDKKRTARKQRLRSMLTKRERKTGEPRPVEIKIQLPRLSVSWIAVFFRKTRSIFANLRLSTRLRFILGGCAAVFIAIMAWSLFAPGDSVPKVRDTEKNGAGVLGSEQQGSVPQYNTVLPADRSIEDLGGWGRVSPQGKEPVYAYVDGIGGVRIMVSQQPLPDTFKKDTEEAVAKLAEGFNANEQITIGDVTAYIGTSVEGPQSVILTKDRILLLIKSDAEITKEQWMAYIGSLR